LDEPTDETREKPDAEAEARPDDREDPALVEVARGVLRACHGKTNLVFAGSRTLIESLADELASQAGAMSIADDIVVHHGSLSKDEREHAEAQLRSGRPCTAVCSNTLELGIDIGAIDEVIQVSSPWSVASLVQRLGRSGRRPGSARILRGFFIEDVPGPGDDLWEQLHLPFVRALAIVALLLDHWIEPPDVDRANLSTLVQQILSILAETGGIRAHEIYPRLAQSGAFPGLGRSDFAAILRELGTHDLIEQLGDSTLVIGLKGQRIVDHYSFYAAFKSPSEYQVLHRERSIGTLPENLLPAPGEHLILAGKRWRVEDIDADRRQVHVAPSRGRRSPRFRGGTFDAAPAVHARMRAILLDDAVPSYLDETAAEILAHARAAARDARIGISVQLLPDRAVLSLWSGTRIHRTLQLVLLAVGVRVETVDDVALHIDAEPDAWLPVVQRFIAAPDARALAACADDKLGARLVTGEKFDRFLPAEIWRASYARQHLDLDGAVRVARQLVAEAEHLDEVALETLGPASLEAALPVGFPRGEVTK
jgi:ATP-dependent Lhr-like helicase